MGVVGIITSWASPLHSVLWHAVPALVSGNCVVIKPSCLAPVEVHLLAKTFSDAGNNIIHVNKHSRNVENREFNEQIKLRPTLFQGAIVG